MSPFHPLSKAALRKMRRAGRAAAATRDGALALALPGTTTLAIDRFVAEDTAARGGRCSQFGYRVGAQVFPGHVCTSRNDVVCHGVPSDLELLEPGDLLNVDVTTELEGYHGDTSRTVIVGVGSPEAQHLVRVAARALCIGIEQVRPGAPLHAIGAAIQDFVEAEGCSVVEAYGGHGIGHRMHLAPHVPHVRQPSGGPRIVVGACFTIEPMVNLGRPEVIDDDDGWTVRTADGSLSAQFEHTIYVGEDGPEILTR